MPAWADGLTVKNISFPALRPGFKENGVSLEDGGLFLYDEVRADRPEQIRMGIQWKYAFIG